MQANDTQNSSDYVSTSDLWQIVDYYAIISRSGITGYGNGFDRKGRAYIVDMCRYHPDFAVWFAQNYPNTWGFLSTLFRFSSDWTPELSDSINVLLGYRSV